MASTKQAAVVRVRAAEIATKVKRRKALSSSQIVAYGESRGWTPNETKHAVRRAYLAGLIERVRRGAEGWVYRSVEGS